MAVTRREFLVGAAGAALAAHSPYDLVDRLAEPGRRRPPPVRPGARHRHALPVEQHLFRGLASLVDNDTVVTVPPLHHVVVTAVLAVPATPAVLKEAQAVLESALRALEDSGLLTFTPAGLGVAVAWGLSYFNGLPPAVTGAWLPVDVAASQANGQTTLAITDAVTYPSDPPGTILEQNDAAFVLASDHADHIATAFDAIFNGAAGHALTITSIRRGFIDGGSVGSRRQSLTKKLALEAGVPGAQGIPDAAELFLGFTSTQRAALGPSVIANFETLPGVTNQWPDGYFVHGTTMHLSHIYEDLVTWYDATYRQRAGFAFTPRVEATVGRYTRTLPEGRGEIESLARVESDFSTFGFIGHSSSMQPTTRLPGAVTDNYGTIRPAGTAVPQRADFNTLDHPFAYSSRPGVDGSAPGPAAGLHFVVFVPTSSSFNSMRLAMDGQYGSDAPLGPGTVHGPFNQVLQTTHRQNFLVPPRAHRSFPLAEVMD
jgi:hypothetical protein